jgi:orotate phosphoribosyltransferase
LVVDDSIRSGKELARAQSMLRDAGLEGNARYFCVFVSEESRTLVEDYGEVCPLPRVFEWNLMHHPHLEYACVDIDGVLCRDPSESENDDGTAYRHFLQSVEPRVVPTQNLGWLVTSRLEKYRRLTEAWLARHGFRYRELVMMQHPDKAARVAAGDHATFKASAYLDANAMLFIESSPDQASAIAEITGRPVFCVETHEMISRATTGARRDSSAFTQDVLQALKEEMTQSISPHAPFILVDEDQVRWSMPELQAIPFLEKDGAYWGPPSDDYVAIDACERLRKAGAQYLVFVWPTFWWLRHYRTFQQYLEQHYASVCDNERIKVFDLRQVASSTPHQEFTERTSIASAKEHNAT